jgi:hypothetical protein
MFQSLIYGNNIEIETIVVVMDNSFRLDGCEILKSSSGYGKPLLAKKIPPRKQDSYFNFYVYVGYLYFPLILLHMHICLNTLHITELHHNFFLSLYGVLIPNLLSLKKNLRFTQFQTPSLLLERKLSYG